jgi:NDP-sugar pyrophosphorylase family protein
MKALIFAAGLGTRLGPFTQNKPKALVELAGKPLLLHAIEKVLAAGITDITINVHHFSEQIISFVNDLHINAQIHISDETDRLLDTGGGLKKAARFLKGEEPVLIFNVDVISDLDFTELEQYHRQFGALATLVVRRRKTSRYLMFDKNLLMTGWKNFASEETRISRADAFAGSEPLAFSGIHVIDPQLFDLITESGKFPIMDLYLRLARDYPIKAFIDQSEVWMDLGKPDQLEKAEKLLKRE